MSLDVENLTLYFITIKLTKKTPKLTKDKPQYSPGLDP